jgi:hypothetical protein
MVEEPAITAVTTPEPEPTVATVVVLLVHVPPDDPSVSVSVVPVQALVSPVMGVGEGLT